MKLKFYSVTLLLQNFSNTFADIKVLHRESPRKKIKLKQFFKFNAKKAKKCDPEFFEYKTLLRNICAILFSSIKSCRISVIVIS